MIFQSMNLLSTLKCLTDVPTLLIFELFSSENSNLAFALTPHSLLPHISHLRVVRHVKLNVPQMRF